MAVVLDLAGVEKGAGAETLKALETLRLALAHLESRVLELEREKEGATVGGVYDLTTTTNTNNLTIPDTATVINFSGATDFTLTGVRGGREGRRLVIHNTGTATITLAHNSGSSDAVNRFFIDGDGNINMYDDQTAEFVYIDSRWRLL